MTEVYYPDLSHPSARALEFMVDGKPVTDRDRRQRRAHLHADERDPGVATHPHVRHRPRARDGADQSAVRVPGRRGPRRRDRVRPAALQRRRRRRRLDPGPRAARPRPPHRLRAGRPPEPHAHELGLQGPRGVDAARAHLRRAAARQRDPAGPHAPHRSRGAPGPHPRARVRPGRQPGARRRQGHARAGLGRHRRRLPGRLDHVPQHAVPDSRRRVAGHRCLRDEPVHAQGARGQGQPGRVRGQPEPAVGADALPPGAGGATSTTSPPRCSRRGTRPARTARWTSCSSSRTTTAGSRPTPAWTARATGRRPPKVRRRKVIDKTTPS